MKIQDIKKKSVSDLEKQASKLRTTIAELKRDRHITEIKNVKSLHNNKKELARVLTVIAENEKKEGDK